MLFFFDINSLLYIFAFFALAILGFLVEYLDVLTTIYWVLFWIVAALTAFVAVFSSKKRGHKIVDIFFTAVAIVITYICSEDTLTALKKAIEVSIFEFIITVFGAFLVHEIMILPVSYTVTRLITEDDHRAWNIIKAVAAIALSISIMQW